jgi:hypothetical protein
MNKKIILFALVVFLSFIASSAKATTDEIGGTDSNDYFAGYPYAVPITSSASGTLQTIGVNVYTNPPTGYIRVAIYDNAGGVAGNLLCESGSIALSGTGWNDVNVSSCSLSITTSTNYWLALQSSISSDRFYFSSGSARQTVQSYGPFPNPFGGSNAGSRPNMRMTYEADTTPPIITIQSPTNITYTEDDVWANVTLNEAGSWCGRSLNSGSNVTLINSSGNWNNQMISLSNGAYNVRFYCNDTSGNMNTTIIYFTVNVAPVNTAPIITIFKPTNTTYYIQNNFDLIFKAIDNENSTFVLKAWLDGNLIYDNSSYANNSNVTILQNFLTEQTHNFTVFANDTDSFTPQTDTDTIIFTVIDYNISTCFTLDQANKTYYLTSNITNSAETECIRIVNNNITLNCQNYALIGTNNGSSIGIDVLNNNFAIKNCIVTNFGTAINDGSTNGANGTINNTQTLNNNDGIVLYGLTGNQNNINVSYSLMNNNTGCGVRTIKVNNINIKNSVLTNNGLSGITGGLCSCDSQNISLSNSSINYNRWGLVMSASVNIACSGDGNLHSVTYSNVSSNNYVGLGMTGNLTFIGNIITNNTFVVDGVTYANISKNIFQNNAYSMQINGITNAYLYNNIFNTTSYFNCLNCNPNGTYLNVSLQSGSSVIPNFTYIGGNYWTNSSKNGYSDTCSDYDYNGFCDVNYTVNAGTDWLPLSLYAYNQSLIPATVNLTISTSNSTCGIFNPSLGAHTYLINTLVSVAVYPICNFTYWQLDNGTNISTTSFSLTMNDDYEATCYFTGGNVQSSEVGGGVLWSGVYTFLNPLTTGYSLLGFFNLGLAGVAVYFTKNLIIGLATFFLVFLTFLYLGFYPSIFWAVILFITSIIVVEIVAKISSSR